MSKEIKFRFESPEESPGYLLTHLTMLWLRKQKKVLDPLNLTHPQFVLLAAIAWLSKTSENVTQVDIANQSKADRMMVSKVLRTLESKKFITRHEHRTDTRAKVVKLTPTGEKVLQLAINNVENTDGEFFSVLKKNLSTFNSDMSRLINENKD